MSISLINKERFNPSSLSNLAVWLDAGDSNTLVQTNGLVTQWKDKSSNGNNFFPTSRSPARLTAILDDNQRPTVYFEGESTAESSSVVPVNSSKTMIAVYRCPTDIGAYMNIVAGTPTNGGSFGLFQVNSGGGNAGLQCPYQYFVGGINFSIQSGVTTGIRYAFASFDASTNSISGLIDTDNTLLRVVTVQSFITNTKLTIGYTTAYPSSNFYLYELIVTSNALSSSDRQEVEAYLADKWKFTLASSHPYKNFQPSGDQWIPPTLPTTISGLVSWLDMTYPGQTTTNVVDRVGGSFNNLGPSPILSNINNLPSLYLPGYGSALYRNINQTAVGSVLLVVTFSNSDTDRHPIIAFNGSPALAYINGTLILGNTNGYIFTTPDPISVTTNPGPNLVFFSWENSNYYLSVNGGTPVVGSYAAPTPSDKVSIGLYTANIGLSPQMNFGELVVYNQYFEQSERQLLEGYLAWKWSIVSKLPSDHPFAIQSPIGATVSETGALNIPGQIAGLTTWLDAADSATVSVGSGSVVTQWRDKSASLDRFTSGQAPIYSNTPITGGLPFFPGVYFSGTQFLGGTVNSGVGGTGVGTCFMVATVGTGAQVLTGGVTGGVYQLGNSFGFVSVDNTIIAPFQGTQPQYGNVVKPGTGALSLAPTAFFARINVADNGGDGSFNFGTPANVGTDTTLWQPYTPSSTPWVLGYTGSYPTQQNFYLHEFLCFSTYLNTTQRQVIEGYLAWKWAIQFKLPSGHPYKNARPQSA